MRINQVKNSTNAKEILSRLKILMGVKTDNDLSKRLGVANSTLATWKSRNSLDWDKIFAFCDNYDLNWIIRGEEETSTEIESTEVIPLTNKVTESSVIKNNGNMVSIPKYDLAASAGYGAFNVDDAVGLIQLDKQYVQQELLASVKDLSAITVLGDSMEPTLRNGDVVIIDGSIRKGDGIFLLTVDDALYVKRMQPKLGSKFVTLKSDNGFYDPMDVDLEISNVNILGRVICSLRKM